MVGSTLVATSPLVGATHINQPATSKTRGGAREPVVCDRERVLASKFIMALASHRPRWPMSPARWHRDIDPEMTVLLTINAAARSQVSPATGIQRS